MQPSRLPLLCVCLASFAAQGLAASDAIQPATGDKPDSVARATLHPDRPKQVIRGLGFESQSDTRGVPVGEQKTGRLSFALPPLSWEFREEQ